MTAHPTALGRDEVHVWTAEAADEPGGAATKLSALAETGANLEYVYLQRSANKPGYGDLFVAPVNSPEIEKAAREVGFHEVHEPIVMRLEGDNGAGLAFELTREWAKAGINLHGTTLAVLDDRFVGYVTFDSVQDANHAATILAQLGTRQVQQAVA